MVPAQGKQGKWPKRISCQGKHREYEHFAKAQGILFAQVVNSLILKVIEGYCDIFSKFF